ncbi:hypothetical protein ID866_7766 [Astraeus odoratus]|nr:hypothetical protein ID866_7766 [Astraeus odoratus]
MGALAFFAWHAQITLTLGHEGVHNHVSEGTDPLGLEEYASTRPAHANPNLPTEQEQRSIVDWLKEDVIAKDILAEHLLEEHRDALGALTTMLDLVIWGIHYFQMQYWQANMQVLRRIEALMQEVKKLNVLKEEGLGKGKGKVWTESLGPHKHFWKDDGESDEHDRGGGSRGDREAEGKEKPSSEV